MVIVVNYMNEYFLDKSSHNESKQRAKGSTLGTRVSTPQNKIKNKQKGETPPVPSPVPVLYLYLYLNLYLFQNEM